MKLLFLDLLDKMNGARTLSGPLHILKGKRSSQTIQDIALFGCDKWAAALKQVPYTRLRKTEEELTSQKLVRIENKLARLTAEGEKYLEAHKDILNELPFNGIKWEWNNEAEIFWQRLSLLVQAVSHRQYGHSSYLPVYASFEVKNDVKRILQSTRSELLAEELHYFIYQNLKAAGEEAADLFAFRLSGYQFTGRTFSQLSSGGGDGLKLYIDFRSTLHQMLENLQKSPGALPGLFPEKANASRITASAVKTGEGVKKGWNLEEIARSRNLKISTIEDHLVELAVNDETFDYAKFISERELDNIFQAVRSSAGTGKLKEIKEALGNEVSYFHIRLALALLHSEQERR